MPDPHDDRRAELIAAALAADLTPAEAAELDRLRTTDPSVDVELEELGHVTRHLGLAQPWIDVDDRDPILTRLTPDAAPVRRPGTGWLALGAAACIAVGIGIGVVVPSLTSTGPVAGPPGTLGAIEPVDFLGEPAGVEIDGDLVAHTWGTETVLTVTGLPAGQSYAIVVIGNDGREYPSGTFLGSDVPIHCAVNAAALREVVTAVEIRDDRGDRVAVATVPAVEG